MTSSVTFWTIAAVLLFWAVGAYNRLMRLRGETNSAFTALEAELSRQVALVRECLPPADATQPAGLEGQPSLWAGLQSAASQFSTAIAGARARPLEPEGIAALSAAQDVFAMAWERAERDDAHDLAGPQLPDTLTARRAQLMLQAHVATDNFDQAVGRYNAAIAQFPAVMLAWLFGFKSARGLRSSTAWRPPESNGKLAAPLAAAAGGRASHIRCERRPIRHCVGASHRTVGAPWRAGAGVPGAAVSRKGRGIATTACASRAAA